MLDLKTIREHTESVKEGIRSKGEDPARIDEILTLDEKRRQLVQHSESLKKPKKHRLSRRCRTESEERGRDRSH